MDENLELQEQKKSVWDKTGDELTVKDGIKVQLTATAIGGAIVVAVAAIPVGIEKFNDWRMTRQLRKMYEQDQVEVVEVETTED